MKKMSEELLASVSRLLDRCLDLSSPAVVDTDDSSIRPGFVSNTRGLLSETVDLLTAVGTYFQDRIARWEEDQDVEPDGDDDLAALRKIGAGISSELAAQELSELALIAAARLQEFLREISKASDEGHGWSLVGRAEFGLGRAATTLTSIESALRSYLGLTAKARRTGMLDDALEIRRQYADLWRIIRCAGEPSSGTIRSTLRAVNVQIVAFRRMSIYPLMRFDDRVFIRQVHERILACISGHTNENIAELWADVQMQLSSLNGINQRRLLIDHDLQLINSVLYDLATASRESEGISEAIAHRLDPLRGRNESFDELLMRFRDHSARDCVNCLREIKKEILSCAE